MFSRLFGPKPPRSEAGRMCFDVVNQIRAKLGHSNRTPLPAALGENPEFVGILLGMMDIISIHSHESSLLQSNLQELFETLWGLESNSDSYSQGMKSALHIMRSVADNPVTFSTIMRTQKAMENPITMNQELYDMIARFF